MNSALLAIIALGLLSLAYRFYSKYIAIKIFELADLDNKKIPTPAYEFQDDQDYIPTNNEILLGHHFSSIAGAAPIVGPAVAAIWGWLPALIWVIFGVIFLGACHDMGTLFLSMKYGGNSMAMVAEKLLGKRVRNLFLIIIFFLVWMVIAVFALVIANLFIKFPGSVIPINFEIIVAVIMGLYIKKKGGSLKIPSILAFLALLFMIIVGSNYPINLGDNALMIWIVFLLIYSFIASTLPVWMLLQPRDYINSHQLFVGLGAIIIGLIVTSPKIVAPMYNPSPAGAPPMFPYLFITIACGAISGFHGLVSGGTTSKQVKKWKDVRSIGYGSMLSEGLLAVIATLAVTAGFSSKLEWHNHYSNWGAANGLSAKISAFVIGAGKFIAGLGIPEHVSHTVIAVLIISFAATSLDTACRIQRYIVGEFGKTLKIKSLENKYVGSFIAVFSAFLLMVSSDGGKGGLKIWPLFGATNQMLAALSLILISVFLIKHNKKFLNFLLPAIFIIIITFTGLIFNIYNFNKTSNTSLTLLASCLLLAEVWIIIEAFIFIKNHKNSTAPLQN